MARSRGARRPPRGPEALNNPFVQIEYPDRPAPEDPREPFMGHPTVPGPYDEKEQRPGRSSPGNGQPGVPLAKLAPGRGPGIPGMSPTAPNQPGAGIVEEQL